MAHPGRRDRASKWGQRWVGPTVYGSLDPCVSFEAWQLFQGLQELHTSWQCSGMVGIVDEASQSHFGAKKWTIFCVIQWRHFKRGMVQ